MSISDVLEIQLFEEHLPMRLFLSQVHMDEKEDKRTEIQEKEPLAEKKKSCTLFTQLKFNSRGTKKLILSHKGEKNHA